jgi:molybdopterin molybdotransferase
VPLLSRVRILLLSTGDELSPLGAPLSPGHIYDSNGASMSVAISESGAELVDALVLTDDPAALRAALEHRHLRVDLIVTTGGVSAGAYEVVRDVFEGEGVNFVSVAMQPGGPQGAGRASIGEFQGPIVAFPGNPVSSLVSFEMFLRPILRELHGLSSERRQWSAPLEAALESPSAKHQVRRGVISENGTVRMVGGASSHLLHSYAASSVLVHVPVGVSHLGAGDLVDVWSIDE